MRTNHDYITLYSVSFLLLVLYCQQIILCWSKLSLLLVQCTAWMGFDIMEFCGRSLFLKLLIHTAEITKGVKKEGWISLGLFGYEKRYSTHYLYLFIIMLKILRKSQLSWNNSCSISTLGGTEMANVSFITIVQSFKPELFSSVISVFTFEWYLNVFISTDGLHNNITATFLTTSVLTSFLCFWYFVLQLFLWGIISTVFFQYAKCLTYLTSVSVVFI